MNNFNTPIIFSPLVLDVNGGRASEEEIPDPEIAKEDDGGDSCEDIPDDDAFCAGPAVLALLFPFYCTGAPLLLVRMVRVVRMVASEHWEWCSYLCHLLFRGSGPATRNESSTSNDKVPVWL